MDLSIEKNKNTLRGSSSNIHPHKFTLWLSMASMTMFFAALTSALIVKRADINAWVPIKFPEIFTYSTIIVVLTSIVLHSAYIAYKRGNFLWYRRLLGLGLISGIAFVVVQLIGWNQMQSFGMHIDGNPSESFIYFISGAHGLHFIGGIVALFIAYVVARRRRNDPLYELKRIIDPKRKLNLELLVTYWHYIDLVWVYLFIFFKMNYL